jgi:hypothetical protein
MSALRPLMLQKRRQTSLDREPQGQALSVCERRAPLPLGQHPFKDFLYLFPCHGVIITWPTFSRLSLCPGTALVAR